MIQIVSTSDGSHTLQHKTLGEHYHSTHGAIQESKHVFIGAGLHAIQKNINPVSILEIGFGTGLNALLTLAEAKGKTIHYDGLEAHPLPEHITSELNYGKLIVIEKSQNYFDQIHLCPWDSPEMISASFQLLKLSTSVQCFVPFKKYDLIYFDAFGPKVQPEMWTKEMFEKMFLVLKPEGILVTYCAQGQVKRNMKAAGFSIEELEGPPGKREITRAIKK